jgi:hypothetical protein
VRNRVNILYVFFGGDICWYHRVYIYGGYKKRYLVKIGVSFIGRMHWEGGAMKGFLEVFINI